MIKKKYKQEEAPEGQHLCQECLEYFKEDKGAWVLRRRKLPTGDKQWYEFYCKKHSEKVPLLAK